ncbi:MAG: polyphosphate polymerase domain-containing protein [Oscillospiraceae bacterium]|nr:polyphosphate polymerase domain-containing protein [Oscillospiraceae bacterium]
MATRHEEKFLIDYRQYVLLRNRAEAAMQPDENAPNGSYLITSLYYDDRRDSALDEKLDGVRVHTKYRVRTYDANAGFIRLERKVKRGIMTEKHSAVLGREEIPLLSDPAAELQQFTGRKLVLATDMRSRGLLPSIIVRYRRDAFVYPETDARLTFDTHVEALPPSVDHLFDASGAGIPALPLNTVVMEVKYGEYLPSFIRKISAVCGGMQLSVSKYALCREVWH